MKRPDVANAIIGIVYSCSLIQFHFSMFIIDLSREPLQFPNLINGFDRNPDHAARSALYTRFTPAEWNKSCMTLYGESDVNRQVSERVRNDAVRLMRITEEKTEQGQREAGRRLG